jgi:hypothetical protein
MSFYPFLGGGIFNILYYIIIFDHLLWWCFYPFWGEICNGFFLYYLCLIVLVFISILVGRGFVMIVL